MNSALSLYTRGTNVNRFNILHAVADLVQKYKETKNETKSGSGAENHSFHFFLLVDKNYY